MKTYTWCAAMMWLAMAMLALTAGCFTRTVYVPEGKAVRLRKDIKNAPVWVKTQDGKVIASHMTLKNGWFCLSMPDEE